MIVGIQHRIPDHIIVNSIIIFELFCDVFAESLKVLGEFSPVISFEFLIARASELWVIIYLDLSLLHCPFWAFLNFGGFECILEIQDVLVELGRLYLSVMLKTADMLT